jgi:hypothetical protein
MDVHLLHTAAAWCLCDVMLFFHLSW